jgi:hypothetical protein
MDIEQQIKQKTIEIDNLKKILEDEKKSKYEHLLGRYFSLAVTCKIKITGIMSADDRYLFVECIRIQGKNKDGNIEIVINDDYGLTYDDIDRCIDEITEEQFKSFMSDCIEQSISEVSTIIYEGNLKKG